MGLISNITYMLPLFLVIGLVIFLYGLYSVHVVGKNNGKVLQYGTVLITMIGLGILWLTAAFYSPVISNQRAQIVASMPGWVMVEVQYNKIRECNLERFNVVFIKGNTKAKIVSSHISSISEDSSIESASILLRNVAEIQPDSFYVESVHKCPFDIEITSDFPVQSLESFKLVPDQEIRPELKDIAFIYIVKK